MIDIYEIEYDTKCYPLVSNWTFNFVFNLECMRRDLQRGPWLSASNARTRRLDEYELAEAIWPVRGESLMRQSFETCKHLLAVGRTK